MHVAQMGVVGTTFRKAGQAGLGYLTLSEPQQLRALHQACDFAESCYLATCNRVEVYFVGRAGVSIAQYRRRLFAFFAARSHARPGGNPAPFADARDLAAFAGEGAVEHLFVVAAALDSMVPGEAQILGQVKAALRACTDLGLAGGQLSETFADAFAIAKQVRAQTTLGHGRVSMFSLVAELLAAHAAAARSTGPMRIAVVGVGDMAEQCGAYLAEQPAWAPLFVNRTRAKAEALAARFGGQAQGLADFQRAPGELAALVTSTSSPGPLFGAAFLAQVPSTTLLVDLAVERDIDLAAAQARRLALWDIDRLQTRAQAQAQARRAQVGEARARIDAALERYRARVLTRSLGGAVAAWRAQSEEALARELDQLQLPAGPAAEAAALLGRRLLGRWLHGPTLGLKAVGQRFGVEAVEAFVAASLAPLVPSRPEGLAKKEGALP